MTEIGFLELISGFLDTELKKEKMSNKSKLYWVCESNHITGDPSYWRGISRDVFGKVPLDFNYTSDIHRAKKFNTREECLAEIKEWEIQGSPQEHMDVEFD